MDKSYFAEDGNFGSAYGLVIVDTSGWSEEDWLLIEEVPDHQRAELARQLSELRNPLEV